MNRIDKNVLQKLYSDNMIYHYTKAEIAIDFILFNNQLRFSHRRKSNDPIENKIFNFTRVGTGGLIPASKENDRKIEENSIKSEEIYELLKERAHSYYQLCFCCNSLIDGYFWNFIEQAEEFGFTKPRMWEQYADNYKGVCIALSKEKLLSKNKDLNLITGNIKYSSYSELEQKNKNINILKVHEESYLIELKKTQDEELFLKHQDYSGENEFRINIEKEKNFKYDTFLNIEDCIEAIIISDKANQKQKETLMEYANKQKVPYFNIMWNDNGIDLVNPEYFRNQMNAIFDREEK